MMETSWAANISHPETRYALNQHRGHSAETTLNYYQMEENKSTNARITSAGTESVFSGQFIAPTRTVGPTRQKSLEAIEYHPAENQNPNEDKSKNSQDCSSDEDYEEEDIDSDYISENAEEETKNPATSA